MPQVPLVAPGINEEALVKGPRMIAIPGAIAMALASVMRPLDEVAEVTRVDATAILSAAGLGTAGVEETEQPDKGRDARTFDRSARLPSSVGVQPGAGNGMFFPTAITRAMNCEPPSSFGS